MGVQSGHIVTEDFPLYHRDSPFYISSYAFILNPAFLDINVMASTTFCWHRSDIRPSDILLFSALRNNLVMCVSWVQLGVGFAFWTKPENHFDRSVEPIYIWPDTHLVLEMSLYIRFLLVCSFKSSTLWFVLFALGPLIFKRVHILI